MTHARQHPNSVIESPNGMYLRPWAIADAASPLSRPRVFRETIVIADVVLKEVQKDTGLSQKLVGA